MKAEALVSRARSMIGQGIAYKLGHGGMKPGAPSPASGGGCDCSGFICWCLGTSRKTDHPFYVDYNNGWIATESIFADANVAVGFFDKADRAVIGGFVVYPDKGGSQGHVGLISEVGSGNGLQGVRKVIHCSSGNHRAKGDAIAETDPAVFAGNPNTIMVWHAGVRP